MRVKDVLKNRLRNYRVECLVLEWDIMCIQDDGHIRTEYNIASNANGLFQTLQHLEMGAPSTGAKDEYRRSPGEMLSQDPYDHFECALGVEICCARR